MRLQTLESHMLQLLFNLAMIQLRSEVRNNGKDGLKILLTGRINKPIPPIQESHLMIDYTTYLLKVSLHNRPKGGPLHYTTATSNGGTPTGTSNGGASTGTLNIEASLGTSSTTTLLNDSLYNVSI